VGNGNSAGASAWYDPVAFDARWRQADAYVDDHRDRLIDLCGRLVAAPSVNPPGDTTAAVAAVAAFLADRGLGCEQPRRTAHKPNLVAVAEGRAPGRHLVLNGHLDTIPPGDEAAWSVPLYEMTRRDGRLYGLGMGNMKGAVAALTLAYGFLARHRDLWPGRLSLTAVPDETVFGPDGAAFLLETRPELLGDALICGEGPGDMGLAIAEKGVCWIEVAAAAPPGQGMLTERRSSAIAQLAEAIVELDQLNDLRAIAPADAACLADTAGEHGLRVSANPGKISGGHFISQVATRAAVEIDFRVPPGLTLDGIERKVAAAASGRPLLQWRRIKGWDANWTGTASPIVTAVARAAEQVRGRLPPPVVRLPASDASRWRALGVPALCYGPQPLLASGTDDFAVEQDVVDCAKVYALAALAYLNGV